MSEALKVLKSAKVGDYLIVTLSSGVKHKLEIMDRWTRKGRNGYVSITIQWSDRPGFDKETFRLRHFLPANFASVEKQYKRKPRAKRAGMPYARTGTEAHRGGFGIPSGEDPELKRLREQVAVLMNDRDKARTSAAMFERLYQAERARQMNFGGGGSVRISADAMQFLRFSGINQFPCSAEDLKKGRVAMIGKLHPDHTQKDSNAQFVSAMRGFEELSKLVK